jgi:hypothetical protein
MALALTHSGTSVYSSDSASAELLVGTADDVVTLRRTERRPGSEWRIAERSLEGSHISSIIFPTAELTFAAIYHGGVMMSPDGGRTWEHRDNGRPSKPTSDRQREVWG